jgi:transposase
LPKWDPQAATFDSAAQLASWVGVCPGREESAEVSKSNRTPKGNRPLRRILSQSTNAAIRAKGSIFQSMYRRPVPRMGHDKTIWAIAHCLCRLVWIILHNRAEYVEYGKERDTKAAQRRTATLIRTLRALGYQVIPPTPDIPM